MASAEDHPTACPRQALPVTLLTGFLGAGKTTRLNASLTSGKEKIAVIENEIGALGVDGELVANRHEDGIIELTNGCLCCSAEVDLVSALESLAHRRQDLPFDRVVVETTGLADVAPVIELIGDPEDPLAADFFLDGVVTVVDADSFRRWASASSSVGGSAGAEEALAGPVATWASGFGAPGGVDLGATTGGPGRRAAVAAFWKQVALADQIIVSKGDVAGEEAVQDARRALGEANPLAQLLADGADSGPLPPPRASSGEEPGGLAALSARARGARRAPPKVSFCGASQKRRRGPDHLAGIDALTLRLPADCLMRAGALVALARALLDGRGAGAEEVHEGLGEAWRVKGLVAVEGMGPALLQCVGQQVALEPWPRGFETPFVVVIGEQLCRERIEAALAACGTCAGQPALQEPPMDADAGSA